MDLSGRGKKVRVPQLSLFGDVGQRVGVLRLSGAEAQYNEHQFTFGLRAMLENECINVDAVVTHETIDNVDVALCSFTSVQDVYALLRHGEKIAQRKRARLVVGGQGVYAFSGWRSYVDAVALGRCEVQLRSIIDGKTYPNVYEYAKDPALSRRYLVRRARFLLPGEKSVGCHRRCAFCQYSATRPLLGAKYTNFSGGTFLHEDTWENLKIQSGGQTTALDGLSEETRRKVRKSVSDEEILDKLTRLIEASDRAGSKAFLRVYQIIGYPWETPESVREDLARQRELFLRARPRGSGRVVMMYKFTPFSPEPLTEMERAQANVLTHWRHVLEPVRVIIDKPHLNVWIATIMPGPCTLYRRVAVNRGLPAETLVRLDKAKTIEEMIEIGGEIYQEGAGSYISDKISVEILQGSW